MQYLIELYAAFEAVQDSERGDHTLLGPMYVNGAEPGDTLEIKILSVDVCCRSRRRVFAPIVVYCPRTGDVRSRR